MSFTHTHPSKTLTCTSLSGNPNIYRRLTTVSMATDRAAAVPSPPQQRRRTMSALEARVSLVAALAIQASSLSQQRKCSNQLPPTHTLEAFKDLKFDPW